MRYNSSVFLKPGQEGPLFWIHTYAHTNLLKNPDPLSLGIWHLALTQTKLQTQTCALTTNIFQVTGKAFPHIL